METVATVQELPAFLTFTAIRQIGDLQTVMYKYRRDASQTVDESAFASVCTTWICNSGYVRRVGRFRETAVPAHTMLASIITPFPSEQQAEI